MTYPQGYQAVRGQIETELNEHIQGGPTATGETAWWCRLCNTGMTGPIANEVGLSAVAHVLGPDHAAQGLLAEDRRKGPAS